MIGPESWRKESKPLDLSDQEVQRLKDAFKDAEFRKLFADYAEEISDPKNRELYEKEILTLETERGAAGTQFLKTEPGICIKTHFTSPKNPSVYDDATPQNSKVFINICTSTQIAPPTTEITFDPKGTGKQGTSWKIPYAMAGTGREDTDRKGEAAMVYDCVFHPDILSRVSKRAADAPFTNLVISTAMEGVQKQSKKKLEKKFTMPKNLKYKGNQPTTLLREPSTEGVITTQPDARPDSSYPSDKISPKSFLSELEKRGREPVLPQGILSTKKPSTASQLIQELSEAPDQLPTTGGSKISTPTFSIINRGKFDLGNHTQSRVMRAIPGRPEELVVRVELPLVNSAVSIQLDITEGKFVLMVPEIYELERILPFPVDQERGSAKFDKGSRRLEVVLPVRPADVQHLPPSKNFENLEPVNDDEEGEDQRHGVPEDHTITEGERKDKISLKNDDPESGHDGDALEKGRDVAYNENGQKRSNDIEQNHGEEMKSGDTKIESKTCFDNADSSSATSNSAVTEVDHEQVLLSNSNIPETVCLASIPTVAEHAASKNLGTPLTGLYANNLSLPCDEGNPSQINEIFNCTLPVESTQHMAEVSVDEGNLNSSIFQNADKGKGKATLDFTIEFENSIAYELE